MIYSCDAGNFFRYDNVPQEINRLRCRVNYHALKFLPEIEQMADSLVSRMRNRTGNPNPYMYAISEIQLCYNLGQYALYQLKTIPMSLV